ncbi:MAG: transglutaminase domain-containing protein [Chloroflexi bacterium]|nr:transglutaminase domain-containing protein [Chloroflexota bacterium]
MSYRSLFSTQGWVTFALLFLVTLTVVWSVQSADWTENSSLPLMVFAGLVTGVALAKVRLHGVILHVAAVGAGTLTTLWSAAQVVEARTLAQGVVEVAERLRLWLHAATSDGASTDLLPFSMGLMVLTWLLGYLCAWFTFRHGKIWVALLLAGTALLNTLSYLPHRNWSYFYLFLFFALLALAWRNISARQKAWRRDGIQDSSWLGGHALYDACLFGIAVIIMSTSLPTGLPAPSMLRRGYEYLRWPADELRGDFNRLFAGVPARKPLPYRIFDNTLPFQGAISLSDDVVFTLKSTRPSYWRVRSYPAYTSQGWVSGATQVVPMSKGPPQPDQELFQRRTAVVQEVELNFSPRVLAAAGIVRDADLALEVEIPAPLTYAISLARPASNGALPDDLRALAQRLRSLVAGQGTAFSVARLQAVLPKDLSFVGAKADARGLLQEVTVKRAGPATPDVLSLRSPKRLYSSDRYAITSSVSVATPQELRQAGEDYPAWVRDLYLQLPDTLPQRVEELADSLTAKAKTPYDKAVAISDYLHTLEYRLDIPAPAHDADGVDHLLFQVRAGYSDYFASAMAVMLRAVGVPGRVAAGYSFGEMDADGNVVVRDSNSHAWTEVYFPGYGWVEFEPTPGRELPTVVSGPRGTTPLGDNLGQGASGEDDPFDEGLGAFGLLGRASQGVDIPALLWWAALGTALSGVAAGFAFWTRGLLATPAAAEAVYRKMERMSLLAGLGPRTGQTPREYGRALSRQMPNLAHQVESVIETYSKARYDRRGVSESEQAGAREAWQAMRRKLLLRVLDRKL